MFSSILIAIPVMIILAIVQIAIFPQFSFFPVDPSLPFLFALAWTLVSNVEEGVVWAFIGGIFMDIFTIAPVGGLALTYMASVIAVNFIRDLLPANRFVIPLISAAVATTIQQLLYYIYLRFFGISATTSLVTLLQIVILQTILIIPIYWFLFFLKRARQSRPVEI